ncbi:MAG: hypothetical protein Q3960_05110 [Lactobacillus sp.]|nr:hypothetical protein [Lactobacillus sp.]
MKSSNYKLIVCTLLSIIIMSSITTSVYASEVSYVNEQNYNENFEKAGSQSNFDFNYNEDGKLRVSKDGYRLFVINGKLVYWPANLPDPTPEQINILMQDRGEISLSIKVLKKAYSKLPPKIKAYISKYLGFETLVKTFEHWTGTFEDGIYRACKKAGMPDWMAWTVAKTFTMFLL